MITEKPVELSCIGVLLKNCPIPKARCHQCWYSNTKGEPTLVSIVVFNQIQERRKNAED